MRKSFSVGLAAALALCVASTANAATSIDLEFSGSLGSVTTITPGFSGTLTMAIILNSDDGLTMASTSIFWDNAGTSAGAGTAEWVGIAVTFNMMPGGVVTSFFGPGITGPSDAFIQNGLQVVNSFDGVLVPTNNPPNLPAGSYQIGTIVWSITGAVGITIITSGLTAFDEFRVGGTNITSAVSFGGATINVVPEPATALLLASGLVALAAGRRRLRLFTP